MRVYIDALCDLFSAGIPGEYDSSHELAITYRILTDSVVRLKSATEWLLSRLDTSSADAIAGATPYLELLAVTMGSHLMGRRASSEYFSGEDERVRATGESNFFAAHVATKSMGLLESVMFGNAVPTIRA